MPTGTSAVRGLAFSRRHTSKPSITGIITSRRMMSGISLSASSRATGPLSATITSKYSLDSFASSSLTFNSTSSTTRTRAVMAVRAALLRKKPLDGAHEARHRNRLGNIGFAAAVANLLLVALHREGGHGDDRDRPQIVILLEPFCDFEPGDLGQLDVHQDQIRPVGARQPQRLDAVLGLQRKIAVRL